MTTPRNSLNPMDRRKQRIDDLAASSGRAAPGAPCRTAPGR